VCGSGRGEEGRLAAVSTEGPAPERENSDDAVTAKSTFSELLKRYRRAAGCSQEALAERSGMSVRAISALEQSSRRGPYRETVTALADALALSEEARAALEEAAANARGRSGKDASVLPAPLTTFIERSEVNEILELLLEHRLVTITGSGGVGKTRVTVEVARRVEETFDQTWFIDVLLVRDPNMLAPYIAARISPTAASSDAVSTIARMIGSQRALLVLDNCEHLIDETATTLAALLRECPKLTVLVTSRESLGLVAEMVFRLPPMSAAAATELFVSRARTQERSLFFDGDRLSIAAQICDELERIPLAIELAASRVSTLGFAELQNRLKRGLPLGGNRGLPVRHQTIDDTIRWSYDLLSTPDRLLLERLSVFIGGFTLALAEAVCADDSLPAAGIGESVFRLVQKSLLDAELVGTSSRYRFLETIRSFGWERLSQTGDVAITIGRLTDWLTHEAQARYSGEPSSTLEQLRRELDNVAAMAAWAVETDDPKRIAAATRAVIAFRMIWSGTNRHEEMRVVASALLARLSEESEPALVGALIHTMLPFVAREEHAVLGPRAIRLLSNANETAHVATIYARLALYECTRGNGAAAEAHLTAGDAVLTAEDRLHSPGSTAYFITAAYVRSILRDFAAARVTLDAIVHTGTSDQLVNVQVGLIRAEIAFREEHYEDALRILMELRANRENYSNSISMAVMIYGNAGRCELLLGDDTAAEADLREALTMVADARDVASRNVYVEHARYAAIIAARAGRAELAARLLGACAAIENPATLESNQLGTDLTTAALRTLLSDDRIELLRASGASENFFDLIEEFLAN
jgi:predicted ATPase/DNA-binding XRE family transcriptional regulator